MKFYTKPRRKWGELKFEILDFVRTYPNCPTRKIRRFFPDLARGTIYAVLNQMRNKWLIRREKIIYEGYEMNGYTITEKGEAVWKYLKKRLGK